MISKEVLTIGSYSKGYVKFLVNPDPCFFMTIKKQGSAFLQTLVSVLVELKRGMNNPRNKTYLKLN